MRMGWPFTVYRRCPRESSEELTQRRPTSAVDEYESLACGDCTLQLRVLRAGAPICHGHHSAASAT